LEEITPEKGRFCFILLMKKLTRLILSTIVILSFIPAWSITEAIEPADYFLAEGDAIRAAGDADIYIINEHGYKRLFVNEQIFSLYGHIGWENVKRVSSEARDAFGTSGLFRNCESGDERVFGLDVISEDVANLRWVNTSGAQAVADDPDFFKKVFCINNAEMALYGTGPEYGSVIDVPAYRRTTFDISYSNGIELLDRFLEQPTHERLLWVCDEGANIVSGVYVTDNNSRSYLAISEVLPCPGDSEFLLSRYDAERAVEFPWRAGDSKDLRSMKSDMRNLFSKTMEDTGDTVVLMGYGGHEVNRPYITVFFPEQSAELLRSAYEKEIRLGSSRYEWGLGGLELKLPASYDHLSALEIGEMQRSIVDAIQKIELGSLGF